MAEKKFGRWIYVTFSSHEQEVSKTCEQLITEGYDVRVENSSDGYRIFKRNIYM